MSTMSAECIPDPNGSRSWVVIVKHDATVMQTIPFPTREKGEEFIVTLLKEIRERAKDEGYI